MTYAQLEHAIRAACNVADDNELWVFGSQAILASFPDPPVVLMASVEVDVEPVHKPDAVIKIDGHWAKVHRFILHTDSMYTA